MSSSETLTDTTWSSLILDFANRLNFHEQPAISTENEYREALTGLCNKHKERDVQRLLTRIRRQHAQIIDFTGAIDEINHFEAPHALSSLVWQLVTKAAQAAFESDKKLGDFVKDTQRLNGQVPSLNRVLLTRYSYETKVQKPLQDLFREYMECYLTMFSEFESCPILSLEAFGTRVLKVKDVFQPCVAEWEDALKKTQAEEQRRMLSATTTSSPGSFGGSMHPHGTNAHFKFVRELGSGTYGDVSVVMEATSGTLYAQKSVRVRNIHDTRAKEVVEEQVKNEVSIMQRLRHHHIASVLFYVRDGSEFSLIMLPVADYDLRHFLEVKCIQADFPRDEITRLDNWFGCLISALMYAHEERIKHEDIKPSNILIKDHRPYLADFGSAKDFSKLEASTSPDQEIAGTPVYWPPESTGRGRSADIFALGCVFSEMLTVRQRRSLADYRAARQASDVDHPYAFRKNLVAVGNWLKQLPGMDKHDSIQTFVREVLEKMLAREPDMRYTAKQIKKEFRREEDVLFCSSC